MIYIFIWFMITALMIYFSASLWSFHNRWYRELHSCLHFSKASQKPSELSKKHCNMMHYISYLLLLCLLKLLQNMVCYSYTLYDFKLLYYAIWTALDTKCLFLLLFYYQSHKITLKQLKNTHQRKTCKRIRVLQINSHIGMFRKGLIIR